MMGRMADARFNQYAREWLLESLAQLVQRQGYERFITAPLLTATPACFPDRWAPNETGARRMIQRLLGYAGLGRYELQIETYELEAQRDHLDGVGVRSASRKQGAAAWFGSIDDGVLHFGIEVDGLKEPESLAGTLGHEVAHAFRHHHRLQARSNELEERLTDLTTVYLGFGILTTNAAYRYRAQGDFNASQWSHTQGGYLSLDEMSYLLAAQAVLRGFEASAISRRLERNQAAVFRESFRELSRDRAGLAKQLGVPLDALPDPGKREIPPPRFNAGQTVSRVERTWVLPAATACALVGLGLGLALWSLSPVAGVGAFAVPPVVAGAVGRRFRRDRCSHPYCRGPLGPEDLLCGRCGGKLAVRRGLHLVQGRDPPD